MTTVVAAAVGLELVIREALAGDARGIREYIAALQRERDAALDELARQIELRIEDEPTAVRRLSEERDAALALVESLTRDAGENG